MTFEEAITRYVAIPDDRKAWFLLRLSWWLTVSMRGCYDDADPELLSTKFKGANEIQHQLSSEAWSHLAQNCNRYPDDVLIRICVEKASHYNIDGEFGGAMKSALDRFEPMNVE
jgi:hypothetical protein